MNKLQVKEIIQGLPPVLTENDVVSLDLELSGLKESQLHRPFGNSLSLQCSYDGEKAYIIFESDEIPEFLKRIEKATWVFHNSTFDLGHLRRWATIDERKNMRDTLLIERLLWSNYFSDFKLNHLVRRYLGLYMDKTIRKEFKGLEAAMTPLQIEYACNDAVGTWLVDKEQQKIISETDKVIWNNLYNPHVWTTLELGGFKLDVNAWTELAEKNQAIVDEISEKLGKEYGTTVDKVTHTMRRPSQPKEKSIYDEDTGDFISSTPPSPESLELYEIKLKNYEASKVITKEFIPFNPSSNAQVKNILLTQYHLDLESTDDDHIRPYYEKNEFVKSILDYRKADKQVTTYGLSFLKNVEEDGRIYTSLNIGLAESGRDSSSSPNLQNIPATVERRKCFVAGEGKRLVLYDYSGQEAGTWAFITGDEKFKEIINNGKKLYIEVARIAFNEEIKKGTPRYSIIKALVLGLMYGLSPYGFARDNREELEKGLDPSLTTKEKEIAVYGIAESMFKAFMVGFPTSAKWMKEQQERNKGIAETIIHRRAHLHPYDRQWKNNALNTPNQGSGGDMIKLAMKKLRQTEFYKKYYPEGKVCLLLQIHDEIVSEVVEELAEEWDAIMKKVMIDVAESLTPGIRGGVSGNADGTGIINNWSEKS